MLARLFMRPRGALTPQGLFRLDSAEVRRLAQQRRARYLAALLKRKRNDAAADVPDRFRGES
jgi:hypothetical protein